MMRSAAPRRGPRADAPAPSLHRCASSRPRTPTWGRGRSPLRRLPPRRRFPARRTPPRPPGCRRSGQPTTSCVSRATTSLARAQLAAGDAARSHLTWVQFRCHQCSPGSSAMGWKGRLEKGRWHAQASSRRSPAAVGVALDREVGHRCLGVRQGLPPRLGALRRRGPATDARHVHSSARFWRRNSNDSEPGGAAASGREAFSATPEWRACRQDQPPAQVRRVLHARRDRTLSPGTSCERVATQIRYVRTIRPDRPGWD